MKTLGIIGGLGPMASAYFSRLLVSMADVDCDQKHLDTVAVTRPSTPDRTAYILGRSDKSPVPTIIEAGRILKNAGAAAVAIPCVTSHCFYGEICEGIGLPVINMIEATALAVKKKGALKVGLTATSGTVETGVFQKTLEKFGVECVVPDKDGQDAVMHVIYDCVKANRRPEDGLFDGVCRGLFESGAENVILGCTELSLLKRDGLISSGNVTDALEELAAASLAYFDIPLKSRD